MANPFDITDDVLRAMANLKAMNEPNWEVIKKWLSLQQTLYSNYTATGTHLTNDQVRQGQGTTAFLFNLCTYIENPEEEIKFREEKNQKRDEPVIKMPS